MGQPRGTYSRGLELVAMALNARPDIPLVEINQTLAQFQHNLRGGQHSVADGATLIWGDIQSLKDHLHQIQAHALPNARKRYTLPRHHSPKYIFHMDHLTVPALRQHGVHLQSKGKADVMIVEQDAMRSLSIKDSAREAKLCQQSQSKTFPFTSGGVTLAGGFNLEKLARNRNAILDGLDRSYKLIALDANEQGRLNETNRMFAIAKHQRPATWDALVIEAEAEAGEHLATFLGCGFQSIDSTHAHNLSVLLSGCLTQSGIPGIEEWITSDSSPVRLDHALTHLAERDDVQVTCAPCTCNTGGRQRGKLAWEVRASVFGKRYLVTRIQPSFEGGGIGVEQTKGIVYHFQEARPHRAKDEGSVWQLLADLSAASDK